MLQLQPDTAEDLEVVRRVGFDDAIPIMKADVAEPVNGRSMNRCNFVIFAADEMDFVIRHDPILDVGKTEKQ